ncbi:hypothetical protein [Nocardiopsis algeriensis]|uniref:Tetratricopeptide (TPR) repeat protein n=1 Tax=Nocardiopsis algeriensis TaxID=1478215 RepID=A0A841IVF7_9ACTN|nr:hypothetical protein [Nocardiopsis algeriensis]MBB6120168.1 tetratricopeptide (TPR) repeat protein [Nocardiopsis algeriensis]
MPTNTLSPRYLPDASALAEALTGLGLSGRTAALVEQDPHLAGEALLDEADALRAAGAIQEALVLLDALIVHAPETEDRQYAAIGKLAILLEEQLFPLEAAHLVADLVASSVLEEGPAAALAPLLEEHGELDAALECYDIAVRGYLSAGVPEQAVLLLAVPLAGRARVRAALGLEPDFLDTAVHGLGTPEELMEELAAQVN